MTTQGDGQEARQASRGATQGAKLRELRKAAKLTQSEAAEALGISGAYLGELERGEKAIDLRLSQRIDDALRTRIDVSYSRALVAWTVSITTVRPLGAGLRPGRVHEVLAKYETEQEACARAEAVKAEREPFARIVVHPRADEPPSTTGAAAL